MGNKTEIFTHSQYIPRNNTEKEDFKEIFDKIDPIM